MRTYPCVLTLTVFALSIANSAWSADSSVDLGGAIIVAKSNDGVLGKAVDMLQDEVERRSQVRLSYASTMPEPITPVIVLSVSDALSDVAGATTSPSVPEKPDGYAIWVDTAARSAATVFVAGHDPRGVLFGVGGLIRKLELGKRSVRLDAAVRVATAPKYGMRGHQLGYRETANSYDGWDLATYEQYIRDMIIFGTNSVELITSLDPGYIEGKVMTTPMWKMNVDLTRLVNSYGLDVWFWMPLEGDVRDPKIAQKELDDRDKFFGKCADIDHIMIPGGDPGRTHPRDLLPWMERMAEVLHRHFPNAGLWLSNQKFDQDQLDTLYAYLNEKKPIWLKGMAYGPSSPWGTKENRERTPSQYALRIYPDITHTLRCQFPVPDWDPLFAQTLDREPPNPRPAAMKQLCDFFLPPTDGFVSYSDGMHDDLNKMVFSALAWDPNADIDGILEDYGRVFFGSEIANDVAKGIRMLEANWVGSPLTNPGIDATLEHWLAIETKGGPALAENWRFQMYLFRAHFDAYVRARGNAEAAYEKEAYDALRRAPQTGAASAIDAARAALAKADGDHPAVNLRNRMEAIGPILHRLIAYQLSVDAPYFAKNPERGALLDKLDRPLNDRPWLESQFGRILAVPYEDKRLAMINTVVNWEDPGPGGFYDDLGNHAKQPHLAGRKPYAEDPGFVTSPNSGYYRAMSNETREIEPLRYSWLDQVQPPEGEPATVRYEGLDKTAQYRVRVTYFGRYLPTLRLVADDRFEIHSGLPAFLPPWPVEFAVPKEATSDGTLELKWELVEGRGVQVPEVWLIKEK